MLRNILIFSTVINLICGCTIARELKEFDNDINYNESLIPHYDLPDPLITAEGTTVTNVEQWRNIRRPQILSLLPTLYMEQSQLLQILSNNHIMLSKKINRS